MIKLDGEHREPIGVEIAASRLSTRSCGFLLQLLERIEVGRVDTRGGTHDASCRRFCRGLSLVRLPRGACADCTDRLPLHLRWRRLLLVSPVAHGLVAPLTPGGCTAQRMEKNAEFARPPIGRRRQAHRQASAAMRRGR